MATEWMMLLVLILLISPPINELFIDDCSALIEKSLLQAPLLFHIFICVEVTKKNF